MNWIQKTVVALCVPAGLTVLMLVTGLGPAWPQDLFTRVWLLAALAVVGVGLCVLLLHLRPIFRRLLSGIFVLLVLLYLGFAVFSINRLAGMAGDEQRTGDAVDQYLQRQGKGSN
jgi:hypothetical protein